VLQCRDAVAVVEFDLADDDSGVRNEGSASQGAELAECVEVGQGGRGLQRPVQFDHQIGERHSDEPCDIDCPHREDVVDVLGEQTPRPLVLALGEQRLNLGGAGHGVRPRWDLDVRRLEEAAPGRVDIAAVLVGVIAFDLPLPQRPIWFALAFVLSAAALLAIGVLIGALVPTAQAGVGSGMLLYFAGIYLPLEIMPEGLRTFSSWTPPGAAVNALGDAWAGTVPTGTSLLVLIATAVVAGGLATRFFRW